MQAQAATVTMPSPFPSPITPAPRPTDANHRRIKRDGKGRFLPAKPVEHVYGSAWYEMDMDAWLDTSLIVLAGIVYALGLYTVASLSI